MGLRSACVVDGCPPRIAISEAEVQAYLDKRRPGQSRFTTQRREPDTVRILSGVFSRRDARTLITTGTPISMMIDNVDAAPRTYDQIKSRYRPGHADYTYQAKYGIRDWRGSGRARPARRLRASRGRGRPQGRAGHGGGARAGPGRAACDRPQELDWAKSTATRSSRPMPRRPGGAASRSGLQGGLVRGRWRCAHGSGVH